MDNCSGIYKNTMDPIAEELEFKLVNNVKAGELFQLCDTDNKGYITVNDLKKIIDDIGLSEQYIEDTFHQLDLDNDGFISAEEFEAGFEKFTREILNEPQEKKEIEELATNENEFNLKVKSLPLTECLEENLWSDSIDDVQLPKNDDLAGLLQDNLALQLWSQMQSQYTEILPVFEEFLKNLAVEHRKIREETSILHNSFNRKSQAYEQQIRVLYEEMEGQIISEKDRLLNKKEELETQLKNDLSALSEEKDKDVQELVEKLLQATNQLELTSLDKVTAENENQQLLQEQEFLRCQLDDYQHELEELRVQLEKAKSDNANDTNNRFRSALKLSEKIAWERETLLKQLNLLRSINRRLQDEKDEIASSTLKETESIENIFSLTSADVYCSGLLQRERGSIVSDYIPSFSRVSSASSIGEKSEGEAFLASTSIDPTLNFSVTNPFLIDCIENPADNPKENPIIIINDTDHQVNPFLKMMNEIEVGEDALTYKNYSDPELDALHSFSQDGQVLSSANHDEGKIPTLCLVHPNNHQSHEISSSYTSTNNQKLELNGNSMAAIDQNSLFVKNNNKPAIQTLETQTSASILEANKIIAANKNASGQQSVFKVIFIGDSGVGKTSIINRICGGCFTDKFCTTIGVDFRVKTICVDGHQVVLQLWDTAGQERFRSITSQYMRRSDGVLILYDVNSEMSFQNVKGWLATMESVNTEHVIVGLIGNKVDICSKYGNKKAVATSDGMLAAADIDALFFETSAKDYFGIEDMISTLARKLRKKQLEDMESCARLSSGMDILKVPTTKKSSCC